MMPPSRRRVRRFRADLRSPARTVLRWVHWVAPGGPLVFGAPGLALDQQRPGSVVIGEAVRVHDDVHFHIGPRGRVEIGAGTVINGHVAIAADRLVRIGAGCSLGRYTTVTDTWSYGQGGDGAPEPETVEIGAGARLGPNSVVGPGVRIEPLAVIEAGTVLHARVGAQ